MAVRRKCEATANCELRTANYSAGGRAAGILLHRVLERWDGKEDVAPLVASLVLEQGADAATATRVQARLRTIAKSQMLQRLSAAETVGREMPISFLDDSGAVVQKRIDRLIRENGVDTVIDYKSGEPSSQRLPVDREQVRLYCAAVERLTGRPTRGALWYVDDERDAVVDC